MRKMVKFTERKVILPIYGGIYGPIDSPINMHVNDIELLLKGNVNVIEKLSNGKEIKLTMKNYKSNNHDNPDTDLSPPTTDPPPNNEEELPIDIGLPLKPPKITYPPPKE